MKSSCRSVAHMTIKKVKRTYGLDKTVPITINDISIRAEPDTGADVNVMDEYQYSALTHRSETDLRLTGSNIKLRTLQSELPVKGEFTATVRNLTCGVPTKFIVIRGRINSAPLISKNTLIQLGMLQIKEDGSFAEQNDMRIPNNECHVSSVTAAGEIQEIIGQHEAVFNGIGRVRDVRNNKELYVQFHVKQEAAPVAQKPRPVAYYLQKPLKSWLDQCLADDIFEEVPQDEPITWCSPLVVQPKPRYTNVPKDELEPNMIRACVDLRVPNRYMERHMITQGPVIEDFVYKFHECVLFSKLDLRSGYHQLSLHPESTERLRHLARHGEICDQRD